MGGGGERGCNAVVFSPRKQEKESLSRPSNCANFLFNNAQLLLLQLGLTTILRVGGPFNISNQEVDQYVQGNGSCAQRPENVYGRGSVNRVHRNKRRKMRLRRKRIVLVQNKKRTNKENLILQNGDGWRLGDKKKKKKRTNDWCGVRLRLSNLTKVEL